MKKLTISVSDANYRQAIERAAQCGMSIGRYVEALIREQAKRYTPEYEKAMRAALAEKPTPLKKPFLTREEVNDRRALRRHARTAD